MGLANMADRASCKYIYTLIIILEVSYAFKNDCIGFIKADLYIKTIVFTVIVVNTLIY